jgi:hypothetical protein
VLQGVSADPKLTSKTAKKGVKIGSALTANEILLESDACSSTLLSSAPGLQTQLPATQNTC